jgi:hypothetical protein
MIYLGTQCKIAAECGLAGGKIQFLGTVGLLSEP